MCLGYVCVLHARAGQQWAHHPGLFRRVVGLAAHFGLRAPRRLHRCTRRARLGLRALYDGAAGTGAGRALADLTGLVACADAGRAGGDGRLENVAAHIGQCGTLGLEHVARQIGLCRARRDGGLQNILGPIDLGALVALGAIVTRSRSRGRSRAATMSSRAVTYGAVGLRHIHEMLSSTKTAASS